MFCGHLHVRTMSESMPVAYGMVLCYKDAASHMLAVACPRVLLLSAVPPPLRPFSAQITQPKAKDARRSCGRRSTSIRPTTARRPHTQDTAASKKEYTYSARAQPPTRARLGGRGARGPGALRRRVYGRAPRHRRTRAAAARPSRPQRGATHGAVDLATMPPPPVCSSHRRPSRRPRARRGQIHAPRARSKHVASRPSPRPRDASTRRARHGPRTRHMHTTHSSRFTSLSPSRPPSPARIASSRPRRLGGSRDARREIRHPPEDVIDASLALSHDPPNI